MIEFARTRAGMLKYSLPICTVAVFNSLSRSPMVRAAYDGQLGAAIKCPGLIEKVFISINGFCNDFVARQFKNLNSQPSIRVTVGATGRVNARRNDYSTDGGKVKSLDVAAWLCLFCGGT